MDIYRKARAVMKECGSRDRGLSEFVGVNHMTEYVWRLPVGEYNNGTEGSTAE
jgi:hypothetical protein